MSKSNKKVKQMVERITGGVFCASYINKPVNLHIDTGNGWHKLTLSVVSIKAIEVK